MKRGGALLLALAALHAVPAAAQVASAPAPAAPLFQPAQTLQQDLDRIAAVDAGRVGIAVVDLASGASASVHADEAFPMASVVKIAVAANYLAEVDAGRRTLGRMITLAESERVGSDGIAQMMPRPGVTLSAGNLIELMLRVSDNTATDMLVRDLGGTGRVDRWMKANRIAGLRFDRTIAMLILDNLGLKLLPGKTAAQSLWDSPAPTYESKQAAAPAFDADPRDTATPAGIVALLRRLDRGEILKPASKAMLFEVMSRCETGADRLKAGLPEGATLIHKTGTLTNMSNDVGIVTLKDGRRFAVAVFTRGIEDGRIRARIAADTARAIAAH